MRNECVQACMSVRLFVSTYAIVHKTDQKIEMLYPGVYTPGYPCVRYTHALVLRGNHGHTLRLGSGSSSSGFCGGGFCYWCE